MYANHVISTKNEILSAAGNAFRTSQRPTHDGVDLVDKDRKEKTQDVYILAFADGVVSDTIVGASIGHSVSIAHAGKILTRYFHMKAGSVRVTTGQKVKKGDILGIMGTTGESAGIHLHFAVKENSAAWDNGIYVDPEPYLEGIKTIDGKPAVSEDNISIAVKHAADIIFSNEGNYGSVNKNDNGALSIGKVQWRASRALQLLKVIVKVNQNRAKSILGMELYSEIVNAASDAWNKRTVNDVEAKVISNLLVTAEGKIAQDELAIGDITTYVNKGMSYGLKDIGALIYFADGVNQYGANSVLWKQITDEALKSGGDVTAMWNATKKLTQNYLVRREKVYKAVCALNLGGSAEVSPTAPPTNAKKSNEEIAREVMDGKWGNNPERKQRLIAAGYDYDAVQAIVNKALNKK